MKAERGSLPAPLSPTLSLQSCQTHASVILAAGSLWSGSPHNGFPPSCKVLKCIHSLTGPQRWKVPTPSRLKLHVQSQQETQTCPVQAALGPQGILGPESSSKRSVKKSANRKTGWGWRHTSGV